MLQTLIDVIETPIKSFVATLSGSTIGTVPLVVTSVTGQALSPSIHYMQYAVWYLTAILAITSIITWVQKQRDRWKAKHNKQ